MSRIGKLPIELPKTVKTSFVNGVVTVEGPKGKLSLTVNPALNLEISESEIVVTRSNDEKATKSVHGLTRQLVRNMVEGVSNGYQKKLIIVGVGYKAEQSGKNINLSLGYANAIEYVTPEGAEITVENPNTIVVKSINKELCGQIAAEIRSLRKPEPYKGKGIKYENEVVRAKSGKAGKA